jgi:hypothetical protein
MRFVLIFFVAAKSFAAPVEARAKRSQWATVEFKRVDPCPATGTIKAAYARSS